MKFGTSNLEYKELCAIESFGGEDTFGVRVFVSVRRELTNDDSYAISAPVEAIRDTILRASIKADPAKQQDAREEVAKLAAVFLSPIYVEEIPYEYCHQWCCSHRRWLMVTTPVGHFKIGWRKRVIHLEWTNTRVKATAEELFPAGDVTKEGRMIHAYGYDKAREYVRRIMESPNA